MARRSARLQKHSPAPTQSRSSDSRDSWETAPSRSNSPAQQELPAVAEDEELAMKTPQKPATNGTKASKASQLPEPTATPSRTPNNRTPIKPTGIEMHPAHHHASTAKYLDEARWLGFQALGAHTAPPKPMGLSAGQDTPTKATPGKVPEGDVVSPDTRFRFRFKSPLSALSPSSKRILKDGTQEAAGRGLFKANEFTAPVDMTPKRKTAVPKGKMARFSDAHMKEFKKMDSIANHPSAFRALQKSSSKVDLSKAESSTKTPNTLKRTQSKMDLLESMPKAPTSALKRTQSKMDVAETTTKIAPTPLKRTQSKMDMAGSSLPRSQTTVRALPPSRDGPRPTQEDNPFAKRVKRTETDDAATARPTSRDGPAPDKSAAVTSTPARKNTGLPRLASRLMTPTKSSIARTQSVKTLKSQSMIPGPSLLHSPSTRNLLSPTNNGSPSPTKNMFLPTNISNAFKEGVRDGIRKTSSSLQRVRSILRTPGRKFSEDPTKIAAGTHMSPPSGWNTSNVLPAMPKTAPVKKHVNFTNSTLERAGVDELGKSPSPMKLRAGSEVPSGAVIYPSLGSSVEYPTIPEGAESASASPSRCLTFGGATESTPAASAAFSFKSDKPINFGPPSTGTIRMVRKSDASSIVEGKKRKLETVSEGSDKENSEQSPDTGRSAKKIKTAPVAVPQTPSKSASKLPRRTPQGNSISKSRLAFLATPKRGKA
ncbi:uncharacterized protein N0V89_001611 [Didymosphaeria variabile]|uniref:Uncharacterized protein n=1 Tax=Didymosphaeria variabile TaxID=1932322 RepID=A0A9W8XWH2_9PLEO|nr:uncharacterized protein N0V89_001611 [Didymosphaeria variabile]KAJ4361042.1 hypothetical protein N0V89_001611 [Didymosphaeria variabile]